jgi:arylsulfatase A-like enzyme
MSHPRPNIVLVLADQLRYQSCGYAGDPLARTPNLDALAKESVSFTNAVVSMPVCAATRASLFTGKYVTSTGMVINELRLNPNHRCLAHCLTDAGYETGYIGKWHLWANQLGHHHDPKNSYIPPGPYRLGFDGHWAAYNFHHEYYNAYYHTDSSERISYGEGVYEPDGQTDMAIDYLRQQSEGDSPFALVLSYGTPHDPWTPENVPPEYYAMFQDVEFPMSPTYRPENDDPYGDAWSDIPKDREKIQNWKRAYYAMTANLDWNVGRLQTALDEFGLAENTVFVFSSDHGEMFGAHGRMKKNIFYDEAARVPFLVKWPGVAIAGSTCDACLNSVDVMPTLLGLAGAEIPADVEGMDLSHCVRGETGPEPEFAFLQNTGACAAWQNGHEWRALRDKQYTYAVYRVDGKELLFDNQADPYQARNLVDDPAFAEVLARCQNQLETRMCELNDTFPESLWYKDHWISEDRRILRTATLDTPPPPC